MEGDVIVERVTGKAWEQGYNAMDDRIEDQLEAGIIDPAKVHSPIKLRIFGFRGSDVNTFLLYGQYNLR